MANYRTFFDLIGRDMASPVVQRVQRSFTGLQSTVGRAAAGMASASRMFSDLAVGGLLRKAGSGIINVMGAATKESGKLEFGLAELQGVAQVSDTVLSQLADTARRLGIETQFAPTEALSGLRALAQQGYNAGQQMQAVESVLLLSGASGGRLPLEQAATLTAQTLKAFGLQADEAGLAIDRMARISTLSGIAIEELAPMFQNASAGAIAMGTDFSDALSALGLIKNIIPSAEMAGSAFAILTQRLADPNKQAVIKETLGIDVVDEATGKYAHLSDLLVDMSDKMAGLTQGDRGAFVNEAFGPRAAKGILSVFAQLQSGVQGANGEVLKGRAAMDHFLAAMDEEKVKGFAKELNDLKLDTLEGQVTLLTGSINTFLGELGKGTAAIGKGAIKGVLSVFNPLLDLFARMPTEVKGLVGGFTTLAGVTLKLVAGIFLLKGGMALLGISFGGLLFSLGKILLIAGPLTLLIGGLGLGVYGMVRTMQKDLGGLGGAWTGLFDRIKLGAKGAMDLLRTGALSGPILQELEKAENKGVARFLESFSGIITKARAFFTGLRQGYDSALGMLSEPWDRLKTTLRLLFGEWLGLTDKGGKSVETWQGKGEAFGRSLAGVSAHVMEFATSLLLLGAEIKGALSGVTLEDVVEGFRDLLTVMGGLADAVGTIADAMGWARSTKTTIGSLGLDEGSMTDAQRMGRIRFAGGKELMLQLQNGWQNIDQEEGLTQVQRQSKRRMLYRGLMGRESIRHLAGSNITDPFDKYSRLDRTLDKQKNNDMNAMTTAMNSLIRAIKSGKIEVPVMINDREVGRAFGNLMQSSKEEGISDQFDADLQSLYLGEE